MNTDIQRVNNALRDMDAVFEEGDLNEMEFKALVNVYTNGVILRAMLQAKESCNGRDN